MSEPITLYRGDEVLVVYAPTWAKELIAKEGWRPMPQGGIWANRVEPEVEEDDVPFTLRDNYVDEPEFVNISEPAPKPRRGRKPKAQK